LLKIFIQSQNILNMILILSHFLFVLFSYLDIFSIGYCYILFFLPLICELLIHYFFNINSLSFSLYFTFRSPIKIMLDLLTVSHISPMLFPYPYPSSNPHGSVFILCIDYFFFKFISHIFVYVQPAFSPSPINSYFKYSIFRF
jgi:hypothetical protein